MLLVGVAAAGAWKYAFIYDILPRYYPDIQDRARPISRREAQKALILRHVRNVVAATHDEVFKALDVLGWTKREFQGAIESVIGEATLREVTIEGAKRPLLFATEDK